LVAPILGLLLNDSAPPTGLVDVPLLLLLLLFIPEELVPVPVLDPVPELELLALPENDEFPFSDENPEVPPDEVPAPVPVPVVELLLDELRVASLIPVGDTVEPDTEFVFDVLPVVILELSVVILELEVLL
jgi:hypothetical protein